MWIIAAFTRNWGQDVTLNFGGPDYDAIICITLDTAHTQ